MSRILLFIATNVAVLIVLTVVLRLLGIESILNEQGTQLDLQALLIFSAVIGFAGSFISLAISKWIAKRSTGARVIKSPGNETERWLLTTVQRQASMAGIGCPEVAVYDSPDINAFATGASRNNALVAVSTGLLRSMDRDSVEAVLGHEVSHVANGDMITLTLIQGVVNTFVDLPVAGHRFPRRPADLQERTRLRNRFLHHEHRRPDHSRHSREHDRDVVLAPAWSSVPMPAERNSPDAARCSRRCAACNARTSRRICPIRWQPSESRGKKRVGLKRLFMSHPPLSERIAALERGY